MSVLYLDGGKAMPSIGLGTWQITPEEGYHAVLDAICAGYRHIDCAHNYGNESEVGRAFQDAMADGVEREELWITSKLWNDAHHPESVRPALEHTLKNLRLDFPDLYLVHWPVAHIGFGTVYASMGAAGTCLRILSRSFRSTSSNN